MVMGVWRQSNRAMKLTRLSAAVLFGAEGPKHTKTKRAEPGHCLKIAEQLVGRRPVVLGGKIKAPKKLRNVNPVYPTRQIPKAGTGAWLGEALIGTDGRIHDVWVLREVQFQPPWPEFNEAISNAIWQWEYAPTTVDGEARPVCITISVNINWK